FIIEFAQEGLRLEDGDTRFDGYTIENGVVRNCSSYGVHQVSLTSDRSSVTIDSLVVSNNSSYGVLSQGWLTLNNATVTRNQGTGIQADYYPNSGTLTLNNATVTRNQ